MRLTLGDKVELNEEWDQHNCFNHSKPSSVKAATVIGFSRTKDCIRIVFDGQVTPQTYHSSFLRRINE